MTSLSLQYGSPHIYEDVIKLYSTSLINILNEFPFRIGFDGECTVDTGGVTHDMFSAFFEEVYIEHFDDASLLVPVDIPNAFSLPPFSVLGTRFSHAYMVAGMLSVKIAFPTLASILLPTVCNLPDPLLPGAFLDCLSPHDARICRDALRVIKQPEDSFPSTMQIGLITTLSRYVVCETPKPQSFLNTSSPVLQSITSYGSLLTSFQK